MKNTLIIILLAMIFTLFADTEVPAGSVSGTWDFAGSPYNINGELQIEVGDTLNIDPGVVVNFTGDYKFIVNGKIMAVGSAGNEILFTAEDSQTGWRSMRFINTTTTGQDVSQLVFCNFEYGRAIGVSPYYQGGALYCLNSSELLIQYCSFSNNSATTGGTMYLQNSHIELNFVEITQSVATGAGGGIYLNGSDVIITDSEITGNTAVYDGGGINCFDSDPMLTRVLIAGNTTAWNGGGISIFNNSHPSLAKITIADNLADQNGSGIACLYNSIASMTNSIVWDNAYNAVYVETGTTFNATYSDFETGSGQGYFGEGCISANPLFTNPYIGDYSLSWLNMPTHDETMSPCIDSGNPGSSLDPDGTIADMGAIFYPQSGIQGQVVLIGGTGIVSEVEVTATLISFPFTEYPPINPESDGFYMISLLSGTYEVTAVLDTYSTETIEEVDVSAELVTLDIELTPPPPGEIVGEVEVDGIGDPTLVLIQAGSISTHPYPVYDIYTNEILYYEYTISIGPGVYDVTASLAGYEAQMEEGVIVSSGQQTADIDFFLPLVVNEGTISGIVTLVGGSGDIENVIISAGENSVSPSTDGSYELIVMNGVYDVNASLDGYSTFSQKEVNVIAFQVTPDINFDLVDGWEQIDGTQYNMVIYATVTYDGGFVSNDGSNQLAVFGYDETGTIEQCRGNATWIAGNYSFWDNFFPLEGFWYITIVSDDISGTDLLWFDFYNSETGSIDECNEWIFFEDGVYDIGYNFTIDSPLTDVTYDLVEGWNWVSFNRLPVNSSVANVFSDLTVVPDIYYIKDQTSFGWFDISSSLWVGGLNYISWNMGYKIQMHNDYDDFTFSGERINSITHPINIEQGWNWISYIPDTTLPIAEALQSISIPDSTCLKTQSLSAVYFGAWIGDLENMEAGKSYLLSWPVIPSAPLFLIYPPEYLISRSQPETSPVSNLADWKLANSYPSNMILMAQLTDDGNIIKDDANYSTGVFDQNGICRSIGKLIDDFWYFTIAGDDTEPLEIRLYDNTSKATYGSPESVIFTSDSILGTPDKLHKFDFTTGNVPVNTQNLLLKSNYPNPFNPTTVFSYNIPSSGQVNLSIFNVKGQLVETLVSTYQEAGEHSIPWNADNYSSGIYLYQLSWGDEHISRKCILMK